MTHASSSRTRFVTSLTPLLCLLCAFAPAAAQSVSPPPAQSAPAQNQTAAPSVKVSFIVATESGSSAVAVRREDVSVVEDGVPQTLTYFAREELPVSYGVLVDNSGSVRDIFHMVLRTAGSIVAGNRPDDETFLIRFVDSGKIEEMQDFTSDRATLMNGLARMYVDGGQTAIIDAVYLSAVKVAERPITPARRRSLVLITDGEDRASSYKLDQLLDLLRRTDVQIFSIGVGPRWPKERNKLVKDKKAKLLLELSQVSGGRAFFASDTAGLRAAVDEITRDLRARYVVGYTPTNADAGDKTRQVEVKVASQVAAAAGLTVTMRPAYSVPKAGGAKAEKKN